MARFRIRRDPRSVRLPFAFYSNAASKISMSTRAGSAINGGFWPLLSPIGGKRGPLISASYAVHGHARSCPLLFRGFAGLDFDARGILTEAQYLERYCVRVGMSELPSWHFYLAFSLFRVAVIVRMIIGE